MLTACSLTVCSQAFLRKGGSFTRRNEYLQEGHSCPGVFLDASKLLFQAQILVLKALQKIGCSPQGTGDLLSKFHSRFFPADVYYSHDNGGERDWVVRSMIYPGDCELKEENLKIESACTIMNCLMKEDGGNKERKVG